MTQTKFWLRYTPTIFGVILMLSYAATTIAAGRLSSPKEPAEIEEAGNDVRALWRLTAKHQQEPKAIDNAGKDVKALWHLTADGEQVVGWAGIFITSTFIAFFVQLTMLSHRVDEMDKRQLNGPSLTTVLDRVETIGKRVAELPHSFFTPLEPNNVLEELSHKIDSAKNRIHLMYMRDAADFDTRTKEYWRRTATAFLAKSSSSIKMCRIASIDNQDKLNFLLEMHESLFADDRIASIHYQLIAFPDMRIKPQRVDIVDDTAFMCSKDEPAFVVTHDKIVENCDHHYKTLANALRENYTILDTRYVRRLSGEPDKTTYGYGEKQLKNIARVIKFVLNEHQPSEITFGFIQKHCDESWDDFQKLFAELQPLASHPHIHA